MQDLRFPTILLDMHMQRCWLTQPDDEQHAARILSKELLAHQGLGLALGGLSGCKVAFHCRATPSLVLLAFRRGQQGRVLVYFAQFPAPAIAAMQVHPVPPQLQIEHFCSSTPPHCTCRYKNNPGRVIDGRRLGPLWISMRLDNVGAITGEVFCRRRA